MSSLAPKHISKLTGTSSILRIPSQLVGDMIICVTTFVNLKRFIEEHCSVEGGF
jgi:hypothetical protein